LRFKEEFMKLGENNLLIKEILSATFLLAVLTGLLYISGTSHQGAYWKEWGVESSLLSSDIYSSLTYGTVVWFLGGVMLVLPAIGLLIVALVYTPLANEIWKKQITHKIINWLYSKCSNKKETQEEADSPRFLKAVMAFVLDSLYICLILLAVLYAFYRLIIFSSDLGAQQAGREYGLYSNNNLKDKNNGLFRKLKTYRIDGVERDAFLVGTDRKSYVLYSPKTKTREEHIEVVAAARITGIVARKNTSQ
jgi:hypothetical protein